MEIKTLELPQFFNEYYKKFSSLTPIQTKSIEAGLLERKNQLICAPTASGKTLIATMGITNTLKKGKSLYLVPLKALANEKFKEYKLLFDNTEYKVGISLGDVDGDAGYLAQYDVIVMTTEKLDSLLRHHVEWLNDVKTVVIDEIHLLNDVSRGPTLEIILTILQNLIKPQIIGLSATIGNPEILAEWLQCTLVQDNWRPVELKKGIHIEGKTEFFS